MKNTHSFPVAKITYYDINAYNSQHAITDALPVATVETVGFLFREDKTCIWIAREIFTDPKANSWDGLDVRGTLVIPKATIVRRELLK